MTASSGIILGENIDGPHGRPTHVLTCYLTRRRVGAFLDRALGDRQSRSTSAHLARCGRCQREADQLRTLRMALHASVIAADPPDWTGFWPGIVRGVEDGRPGAPLRIDAGWWRRRVLSRPRVAFGGALAAAVLVSMTLWQVLAPTVAPEAPAFVTSANTEDPRGTVLVYSPPERDLTVVWVLGLD